MKKVFKLILVILLITTLKACLGPVDKHERIFNELKIDFYEKEDANNVKNDFNVKLKSKLYSEAIISWESSNSQYLNIIDDRVLVIRDKTLTKKVTLTILVEIDNVTKSRSYELLILSLGTTTSNKEYIVKYIVDNKTYASNKVVEKESIVFPTNPIKEGFIFIGWSYQGKIITSEMKVLSNMTLNAVFNDELNHITKKLDKTEHSDVDGLSRILIKASNISFDQGTVKVYLNGILFTELLIAKVSSYTLEGINILGEYEIKIVPSETVIISEMAITNYVYRTLLIEELNLVDFVTKHYKETLVNLTTKTLRGVKFSLSLEKSSDSQYFDLARGLVFPPTDKLVLVNLVVNVSYQTHSTYKIITFELGVPRLTLLEDLTSIKLNEVVRTKGVITGFYEDEKSKTTKIFIKEGNEAALLTTNLKINVKKGDVIYATGFYVGYKEVLFDVYEIKGQEKTSYDLLLSLKKYEEYLYKYLYVEGIITSKISSEEFYIYLDGKVRVKVIGLNELEVDKGFYVELFGYLTKSEGELTLIVLEDNAIEAFSLSNNQIVNLIFTSLNLSSAFTYQINNNFPLPKKDLVFGAEIIWESSHPNYLTNDGIYILKPQVKTNATLTAIIKLDEKIIGSRVINVVLNS